MANLYEDNQLHRILKIVGMRSMELKNTVVPLSPTRVKFPLFCPFVLLLIKDIWKNGPTFSNKCVCSRVLEKNTVYIQAYVCMLYMIFDKKAQQNIKNYGNVV